MHAPTGLDHPLNVLLLLVNTLMHLLMLLAIYKPVNLPSCIILTRNHRCIIKILLSEILKQHFIDQLLAYQSIWSPHLKVTKKLPTQKLRKSFKGNEAIIKHKQLMGKVPGDSLESWYASHAVHIAYKSEGSMCTHHY